MIRDVGSLDTLKTLVSQVAKNLGLSSSQPVSIEVMDKLDLTKYLIKLGDKTLEALSQKELAIGIKYWAELKSDESGLAKLTNLAKKPDILQNVTTQNENPLTKTLDFEKLKSAVNEYTKAPQTDVPIKSKIEISQEQQKNSGETAKESTKQVKTEISLTKQDVESKLAPAKAEASKQSQPQQASEKVELKNEASKKEPELKIQTTKQEVEKNIEASKQLDTPDMSKTSHSRSELQTKEQVATKEVQVKAEDTTKKDAKSMLLAEKKEEKASNQSEAKENQAQVLKSDDKKESTQPRGYVQNQKLEPKKDEPLLKGEQSAKREGVTLKEMEAQREKPQLGGIQKLDLQHEEQRTTQTMNKKDEKQTQREADVHVGFKKEVQSHSKEIQKDVAKTHSEENVAKAKNVREETLEALKQEFVGGEITAEELASLIKDAVKQESIAMVQSEENAAQSNSKAKEEKGDGETGVGVENDFSQIIPEENLQNLNTSDVAKEVKKDRPEEAKNSPSSKIKSEILNEMTKTESKEQFQIFSNLALNLNRNGFTMFVKGEDGKDGVLQFRKKSATTAEAKSVEFYSAFEHLGPISGEISQYKDQTYLSMEVEFESTMKALVANMDQLEFFDKKNVVVKQGIAPLFELKSSLLNLIG